jgi:hypothetical protein
MGAGQLSETIVKRIVDAIPELNEQIQSQNYEEKPVIPMVSQINVLPAPTKRKYDLSTKNRVHH